MKNISDVTIWVAARFILGFILLWAFFDKLFGLGFATSTEKAWMNGGSPTTGFLTGGVSGPFADFFHGLAGQAWVDWLFMLGLLLIGISLVLGIGIKIAGWSGAALMSLMWLALLLPQNNPILDEHIVYALVFIGLATSEKRPGQYLGLGKYWTQTSLVQRHRILE